MSSIKENHRHAMQLAEESAIARMRGDLARSRVLLRRAFEIEDSVASIAMDPDTPEPSRSLLLQSAAALAIDCGEHRRAEVLAASALSGNPPSRVLSDLRHLLEKANFARHLDVQGLELEPNDVQMVVTGNSIAPGFADGSEVTRRIDVFQKLVYRVAESGADLPYRIRGEPPPEMRDPFRVFVSVPRAGSFAVTLRVAREKDQQELDTSPSMQIVDDVLDRLDMYQEGQLGDLEERFGTTEYYHNFIELAKSLSPDGSSVKLVGFTSRGRSGERRIQMTRKDEEAIAVQRKIFTPKKVKKQGYVVLANSRQPDQPYVMLRDEDGKEYRLRVPPDLLERATSYVGSKRLVSIDGQIIRGTTIEINKIRAVPRRRKK